MTVLCRGTGGTLIGPDGVREGWNLREDVEVEVFLSPGLLERSPNSWYQGLGPQLVHSLRTLVGRGRTAYRVGKYFFLPYQNSP